MNTTDTLSLLKAAQEGDNTACERMLHDNAGLIWSIVRRYGGRGVDSEDLYQLGCLGFIKAVRGFDASFGTQFSTYAVPKIAGEIRRFLRDDGTVKVGRGFKERAQAIRCARDRLEHALGREPTLSEIAKETDLAVEDIAVAELATGTAESLQQEVGEGMTLENILGTDSMEEKIVEKIALREAVRTLPQREQMVILLRFFKSLTQEQAARVMGVSQVQISRIERRAIAMLRSHF